MSRRNPPSVVEALESRVLLARYGESFEITSFTMASGDYFEDYSAAYAPDGSLWVSYRLGAVAPARVHRPCMCSDTIQRATPRAGRSPWRTLLPGEKPAPSPQPLMGVSRWSGRCLIPTCSRDGLVPMGLPPGQRSRWDLPLTFPQMRYLHRTARSSSAMHEAPRQVAIWY